MGRLKNINWTPLLFIVAYHSFLFVLLPYYLFTKGMPSVGIIVWTISLFIVTGLGITAGYHRLYAHKSYEANPLIKGMLLFFGTLAAQNDVIKWSLDHRIHHAHTDTDKDPYSIKRGFLDAHFLWLFRKEKDDFTKVPDLLKDPIAMFFYRNYTSIYILSSALIVFIPGLLYADFLGALVFVYLLRTFLMHHVTFFINSLAHTKGSRKYNEKSSAADNYLISLITFGEGYHNYHHAYPSDYRNGIRWYHFDPGKWLVYSLSKVKLTRRLTRMT